MNESIQNYINVTPRVTMSQSDYNKLMELAQMTIVEIEKRARKIYEEKGVLKIDFTGRFYQKRGLGVDNEKYEFSVACAQYLISDSSGSSKSFFEIPQKSRQKIAKIVKNYVEDAFAGQFGEHMTELNEILRLKNKQDKMITQFLIVTAVGWVLAVIMCIAVFLK